MNVLEAIKKRRSVRKFKPDPIPEDVLARLLEAMRLAPSGSNRQPWKFIVVRDQETRKRLGLTCGFLRADGRGASSGEWVGQAPMIFVACCPETEGAFRYYQKGKNVVGDWAAWQEAKAMGATDGESSLFFDMAIALDHFSLAAVDEGLGTCWIGGFNEKEAKQILGVPDGQRALLLMPVGYPVSWPEPRPRKSIEEIVYWDKYA